MPARSKSLDRREPSGRIARTLLRALDAHSPAQAKRLRDAALRGMQAPEYGTELGRLFLADKITPSQYEAGKRWARLREELVATLGLPPISPRLIRAYGVAAWSQKNDGRERALLAILTAASQALGVDAKAEGMVVATCEHERPAVTASDLKNLQLGLDALAVHWHLTA